MTYERRERIIACIEKLEEVQVELEEIKDEEQEYYENMPEDIQSGVQGDIAEVVIFYLVDAISNLEDTISSANAAL